MGRRMCVIRDNEGREIKLETVRGDGSGRRGTNTHTHTKSTREEKRNDE